MYTKLFCSFSCISMILVAGVLAGIGELICLYVSDGVDTSFSTVTFSCISRQLVLGSGLVTLFAHF